MKSMSRTFFYCFITLLFWSAAPLSQAIPLSTTQVPQAGIYDAVIVAVGHRQFVEAGAAAVRRYGRPGAVLYDVKGIYPRADVDGRL